MGFSITSLKYHCDALRHSMYTPRARAGGELLALLVVGALLLAAMPQASAPEESQYAWLRMSIVSTDAPTVSYVSADPDPWLVDSWVVETRTSSGTFTSTIGIENIKNDRNVYDIVLVLVTNNPSVITSLSASPCTAGPGTFAREADGTLTMLTDAGENLGEMPPHGVYNDPSAEWTECRTGVDLNPYGQAGDSMTIGVSFTISGAPLDWRLHLDVYGWTEETSRHWVINGDTADAAFSPFSSDITFTVPEFGLSVAVLASLFATIMLLRRRAATKPPVHK